MDQIGRGRVRSPEDGKPPLPLATGIDPDHDAGAWLVVDPVERAVELGTDSDMLGMQATALLDLAGVLRLAGRDAEVAPLARQALELAERKGHTVAAAQARELLDG